MVPGGLQVQFICRQNGPLVIQQPLGHGLQGGVFLPGRQGGHLRFGQLCLLQ